MKIKLFGDLTDAEQEQLGDAWAQIARGLNVYERLTGAYNLADIVYEDLWETIEYQQPDSNITPEQGQALAEQIAEDE